MLADQLYHAVHGADFHDVLVRDGPYQIRKKLVDGSQCAVRLIHRFQCVIGKGQIVFFQIAESKALSLGQWTEPIAVAFAAAKAREVLGCMPEAMVARCSGNIIKNVKSVIVPNSGNERGVEAAAVLGAVAGQADLGLQVISQVTPEQIARTKELLAQKICRCELEEGEGNLYILITVTAGDQSAAVEVRTKHDHISRIVRNGEVLFEQPDLQVEISGDKSQLNLKDILEFANTVDLEDVRELLETQISYNTAIAEEGLNNFWGASVGRTILDAESGSTLQRARAAAAAGSDARMNGCALPVVINSGSGNQGITVSVPVIEYARELGASEEMLCRALALANLIAIHEKTGIGRLSAYCGAVSAGCAAGCGIAYLQGADCKAISHTLVNSLAIVSGIICDGAKPSCAAKIASSVQAGILGYHMYLNGQQFRSGDGIVTKGVEATIRNVGRLGRDGMRETDKEIVKIMLHG